MKADLEKIVFSVDRDTIEGESEDDVMDIDPKRIKV